MALDYTGCMIFQGNWLQYWSLSGSCKSWGKLANK